jgi:hypothetical protein
MFIRGMMGLLLKLHILQGVCRRMPGTLGRESQETVCGGAEEVNPAPHG